MTLVGHDAQRAAFRAAIDSGRLHHAWLLHGPQGVGKAGFAKTVAARLLAESGSAVLPSDPFELPEEHPTARLLAARSHPDFVLVEREAWVPKVATPRLIAYADRKGDEPRARNIRVLQIRWLEPVLALSPSMGGRRVVVIDAADDLERGAANALLKMLEEPPAGTVFLLVSHAPGALLPTLRSRCRPLAFSRLDDEAMRGIAERAKVDEAAIAIADGIPGALVGSVAGHTASLESALHEIATTGDPTLKRRMTLADALAAKAALPRYEALLQRVPAFIAARAGERRGAPLATAIAAWEAARTLADTAIAQSHPIESVVFELAGHVAALAPTGAAGKG